MIVNRAVARAACDGAAVALSDLEALEHDPRMKEYQPYWAALAHVSALAGKRQAARRAFDLASGLCLDAAVRAFLHAERRKLGESNA